MSYPDLGCFAECLECELCDAPWEEPIDLDLPDDYDDWDDGGWDDWDDWGPDPDEGDMWDDFPSGVPIPGGGEARPTWPPGIELEWPF